MPHVNEIWCALSVCTALIYRVSHKDIDKKKLLFWPVHCFNSQFLNLFGFSISGTLKELGGGGHFDPPQVFSG